MIRNKALLWSISLFLALGGLLLWLFWGNRGVLIVQDMPDRFLLTVSEYGEFHCEGTECRYRVPFGERMLCLQVSGYKQVCETVRIPWQKEYFWSPRLERLPHLSALPSSKEGSENSTESQLQFSLDLNGQLIKTIGTEEELITKFFDTRDTEVLPLISYVFVRVNGDIFQVDPVLKSKNRVFSGNAPQIHPASDQLLIIEDDSILHLFDVESGNTKSLPFTTAAKQVVSCLSGVLYFAEEGKNAEFKFGSFDLNTGKVTPIISMRIEEGNGLTLSCHPNDKQAVIISFPDHEQQVLLF